MPGGPCTFGAHRVDSAKRRSRRHDCFGDRIADGFSRWFAVVHWAAWNDREQVSNAACEQEEGTGHDDQGLAE